MVLSLFERSEVGLVPEPWDVKPLGSLFDFNGGYSASRDQLSSKGLCYLHYGDIHGATKTSVDTEADFQEIPKLNIPLRRVPSKSLLKDGDVVFVDASEDDEGVSKHIVVVNKANRPFIAGLHTIVASGKTDELAGEYRHFCFQAPAVHRQFLFYAVGTKVSGISKTNIRKVLLPVPPLPEQRAIAQALSDVDALVAALDRLIAKKRDLKQAAMQQLLTGRTRLPGFEGPWRSVALGELISHCFSGATPRRNHPDYFKGDIRWITSGELNYNIITDTKEKITAEAVERTNLSIIPEGTFLMAITGLEAEKTRGSCGIVGAPSTTNQSCMAVFPNSDLVTEYLFHYYVLKGKSLAVRYCQGTKQQSYTATLVKKLPIDLPPTREEQTAIARVIANFDSELGTLQVQREKIENLKRAMMQELLTGRTRLV